MVSRTKRALAIALLSVGITGGAVLAADPTPTVPTGNATVQPGNRGQGPQGQPGQGGPQGQPGQGGPGRGGPGMGQGPQGTPTTASVTDELTRIGQELTSVKADRDFANGKMDLATVNALIDKATAYQGQAQSLAASDATKASGYARAAMDSLHSARDLIVAAIGTTGLPSAANRPAPQTPATQPTADQQKARASNDLAHAYQDIVNDGTTAKANGGIGDLGFFVTTAQTLYKQAYDLYNAGKYDQASRTAHVAQSVGRTVNDLLRANGVTTAPAIVTVPAPNF